MKTPDIRGILYLAIPLFAVLAERMASWVEKPPTSPWEYGQVVCAGIVASLTAYRAYIDQFLSQGKKDDSCPKT